MRRIALQPPAFRVDWAQFGEIVSDRTRLVILNMSHNPSASVWQADDFQQLWQAIAAREIYVLSDEVCEQIGFAPGGHQSVLVHDGLRQRAIAVSSFGKTYHMTGWKVGYCAPHRRDGRRQRGHRHPGWRGESFLTCAARRRDVPL